MPGGAQNAAGPAGAPDGGSRGARRGSVTDPGRPWFDTHFAARFKMSFVLAAKMHFVHGHWHGELGQQFAKMANIRAVQKLYSQLEDSLEKPPKCESVQNVSKFTSCRSRKEGV